MIFLTGTISVTFTRDAPNTTFAVAPLFEQQRHPAGLMSIHVDLQITKTQESNRHLNRLVAELPGDLRLPKSLH